MTQESTNQLKNNVRFVTATALFDGHDASINIMRRLLQQGGAEVIHLGHNRSVQEIVSAAIQEDAQAIAVSSYQGGHLEFFSYMREELDRLGRNDIKIFGGGGGVIIPKEIETLHSRGITRIYSLFPRTLAFSCQMSNCPDEQHCYTTQTTGGQILNQGLGLRRADFGTPISN